MHAEGGQERLNRLCRESPKEDPKARAAADMELEQKKEARA